MPKANSTDGDRGTFAPSCIIAKDAKGKLTVFNLSESADPVLELRDKLRKLKGRDDKGQLQYSHVLPIIRGKSTRQLHFA